MRWFRPPLRFWTISTASALALAVIVACTAYHQAATGEQKSDLVKIYMQALFTVLAGGVVLTFLNVRRDEDQRDVARDATVREIVGEMQSVQRKLKMVKRRLRSQMSPPPEQLGGHRTLPYTIPSQAFEHAMEDLLSAQLEAEEVRDSILARDDILSHKRISRVHVAMNYTARYAHDVYQTVEDCTVSQVDGLYRIDQTCKGLVDFLGRNAWNSQPITEDTVKITAAFETLRDETVAIKERYGALHALEEMRQRTPGKPRYRIVATACIALACADLQRAVRRERWRDALRNTED